MATNPIGPMPGAVTLHPFAGFDRHTIASAVEVLMTVLDTIDGDADVEPAGDEKDVSWTEWGTMRGSQKGGHNLAGENEDDEPTGDEQDGTLAEDEECASHGRYGSGPGCIVADPDEAADDKGCDPDEGV